MAEILAQKPSVVTLSEVDLWDALDGLHAYDSGCIDSGVCDEVLRAKVKTQLQAMPSDERGQLVSRLVRDNYLSDDGLEQGYTISDVVDFYQWLDEEMECGFE